LYSRNILLGNSCQNVYENENLACVSSWLFTKFCEVRFKKMDLFMLCICAQITLYKLKDVELSKFIIEKKLVQAWAVSLKE